MFLVPYRVDVPMKRVPFANWAIIGSIVVVSFMWFAELERLTLSDLVSREKFFVRMILTDWSPVGLFGHVFLHGGFFHLIGNMLTLWVFGNAVCAKIGNVAYLFAFFSLGLAAAAGHLIADGGAAIGASGAAAGVVGLYVVLYPLNDISCAYFFWIFYFIRAGTFSVAGFWIVLLRLAFDLFGLVTGAAGVGYVAHLSGFAAGFAAMALLVKASAVKMDPGEQSLFYMFGMEPSGKRPTKSRIVRPSAVAHDAPQPFVPPPPLDYPAPPPQESRPATHPANRPSEPPAALPQQAPEKALRLKCACGNRLQVPAVHAGKVGQCPSCGKKFRIPAPPG